MSNEGGITSDEFGEGFSKMKTQSLFISPFIAIENSMNGFVQYQFYFSGGSDTFIDSDKVDIVITIGHILSEFCLVYLLNSISVSPDPQDLWQHRFPPSRKLTLVLRLR